jgi:hypothetical protein
MIAMERPHIYVFTVALAVAVASQRALQWPIRLSTFGRRPTPTPKHCNSASATSVEHPTLAIWTVRPASTGHAQDAGGKPHSAESRAGSAGPPDLSRARRRKELRRRQAASHSVIVRARGLVFRKPPVCGGAHDISDGAQHRWSDASFERSDHRAQSYPQSGDGRLVLAKRREFDQEGERS